jgi:hypothetical protein
MLGLALGATLVTACAGAASPATGASGPSSGGITFKPSTFSCSPQSSAFVASSATLPSSVTKVDQLTWQLDGKTIDFGGGPLSSPHFLKQSDGSWLFTDLTFVAYLCNSQIGQGIGQRPNSIGAHTISVLDAGGSILAGGSFTVTDSTGAVPPSTRVNSAQSPQATTTTVTSPPKPAATSTVVTASTAAPAGGSGTALDPCSAVTPAELEAILGVPMGEGMVTSNVPSEEFYPKGMTDCVFFPANHDPHPYADVKIGQLGDFPPDKVCHPDPRATSTAVSLGDEGCWVAGNNPDLSELRVRKGSSMVVVVAYIPESQAKHQEATLRLAELIVGRM